jgi:hypothetical protein
VLAWTAVLDAKAYSYACLPLFKNNYLFTNSQVQHLLVILLKHADLWNQRGLCETRRLGFFLDRWQLMLVNVRQYANDTRALVIRLMHFYECRRKRGKRSRLRLAEVQGVGRVSALTSDGSALWRRHCGVLSPSFYLAAACARVWQASLILLHTYAPLTDSNQKRYIKPLLWNVTSSPSPIKVRNQ